jgi:hypothetical protein
MSNVVTFHIEVEEEADTSFRFNYNHNSTGLPMDLTGYRAEMQVRKGYTGSEQIEPLLVFTSDTNNGIVLGGPTGTIDIFISYEDTRNQTWDKALYTLTIITPHGARSPFVKGFFTINKGATLIIDSGLVNNTSGATIPSPNNNGKGGLDSNG